MLFPQSSTEIGGANTIKYFNGIRLSKFTPPSVILSLIVKKKLIEHSWLLILWVDTYSKVFNCCLLSSNSEKAKNINGDLLLNDLLKLNQRITTSTG